MKNRNLSKITALVLVLVMVFGLSATALAEANLDPASEPEALVEGPTVIKDPESPTGYTVQFVYKNEEAESVTFAADILLRNWAFMNEGGAASLLMPMWFMGRFTQYMPDLSGKMTIRPMPAWEEGGMRSAGMGGTGTAVTNQAKDIDLAVDFLGFAKASKEGAIKTWTLLGFDPIRWDVWDAPEISEDNQYTDYFGKDIFNMLKSIKDEINPVYVGDRYPAAVSLVQKEVLFKVLEEGSMTAEEALKAAAEELRAQ